ncbi:hypothetical protein RFM68_14710 [Mesorhizobium sp. MSK_1335]|uniref:Uncharacterized protein n=1 Tax=Mesorhizobium montanum TaxID=3072323 RepID=A0ABU4ZK75_9HYPH|nr:hypothetical protein [Mesorhizobium sp. MSK_1335]MDX8525766.1 hypothetical protein [Mesorhizobium sp. MSK_1335]
MDITSTRLNTLIGEALTPQPVPLPKADPATTALIKTLVQPPAPPSVQAAQFAAQTLTNSLQVPPARSSQRSSSSPVEDAYRAMMEPDTDAEDTPAGTPQGRPVADADHGLRANASAQPPVAASAAGAAPVVQPPSSVAATVLSSPALIAANANAPPRGGVRPSYPPRSDSVPVSLWTIAVVTAVVSAVTATIMVLLLR